MTAAARLAPLTRDQWIDKFGRARFTRDGLRLETCACDDPACRGWQAVYPNQNPSLPVMTVAAQLARCDSEIAAMAAQEDAPAWLVALGIGDWERERELIQREAQHS